MVARMAKTTIDIADALLDEAKQVARERGTTLRELVEGGLRLELVRTGAEPYELPDTTVDGNGLTPEFVGRPFREVLEASYGDRL